jgi:prepilin-type N-terminal cleavage/methylation domain-containing protein
VTLRCRFSMCLGRSGFTLIEMMISIVLLSVILGSLFGLVIRAQRDYVRQRDVDRAQEAMRSAELAITTALRNAKADPYVTGSSLIDPTPSGGTTYDAVRIKSDYNPSDGDFNDMLEDVQFSIASDTLQVRWEAGGSLQAFTFPIDSLKFEYFDSAGTTLTTDSLVDANSTGVRVTIVADKGPRSGTLHRRQTWVYMRN